MGLLPSTKSIKKTDDPRNLIIFGLPKVGKTTALAQLPNTLIVDLENGSDYVEGFIVKANNVQEVFKVAKSMIPVDSQGNPNPSYEENNFKFIVIDTVTALEDMCLPLAKQLFMKTPLGRNYDGEDVRTLPNGQGYLYIREAMKEIIGWFKKTGKNVILTGHVKDKSLVEGGSDLNVKALDLNGKLSTILSADSDAIGYVYRDTENGNLMINFGDMNSVLTGSRITRLAGKTIQLAERTMNDKGEWEIITHWDRIFPSLNESHE